MSPDRKPAAGGKPGAGAPKKPAMPGQPGQQPGDEWGEDNPGNQHGVGVDDHVFFHRDGAGPHAGKVVAHGVHGCQVADDAGGRHKVRWSRVLGLKKRAVHEGNVVDRGESGSIVEHKDGRRVFVAGDLGVPDDEPKLRDVAGLEDAGRAPRAPRHLVEREEFARHGSDMVKAFASADHECEGPALCRTCRGRAEREDAGDLMKAFGGPAAGLAELEARARALRAGSGPRSVRAAGQPPLLVLVRS